MLAEGGLVGLSAGLEIATEKGLENTRKGITLEGAVASLAALKANGILVHAYLIYGWPGQGERDLIDSMEIVRQLFAAGLVDSAFWHRFILTRHSPIYAEWKAGLRPDLSVVEPEWTFGSNDLAFEGEERFERYGAGLDEALGAWMEGAGLHRSVTGWFTFKVAKPSVSASRVANLARAAQRRQSMPDAGRGRRAIWLGGRLIAEEGRGGTVQRDREAGSVRLAWSYRNRLHRISVESARARPLIDALAACGTAAGPDANRTMDELLAAVDAAGGEPFETTKEFQEAQARRSRGDLTTGSRYFSIDDVKRGETVLIFDRDTPVARLEPVTRDLDLSAARMSDLVKRGAVAPPRKPLDAAAFLDRPMPALAPGSSGVRILLEEREAGR